MVFFWEPYLISHFCLYLALVAQSCLTLCDPVNCSPLGSSVHGILQARILEWVAVPFSRGSSWPRDQTWVSRIAGTFFTVWAIMEAVFIFNYSSNSVDYSAIKKNTFESVLMRWMKLEPIIQSEVSQKEKHQYSILTHIWNLERW